MNSGAYDSILYLAYGVGCATLALATVTAGTLRHRLHNRNLWRCCGFGLGQGCALLFFAAPEHIWPHVLLKTVAAHLFYLFGWLNLRDFVLRRGAWWHRFMPYLPAAGLPVVVVVEPRWMGLELVANIGLCAAGAGMASVMAVMVGLRSERLALPQLRYRAAALGIAVAVAAFGVLTVADSVVLLRNGVESEGLGLARSLCLLAGLACTALLLRQISAESFLREDQANVALAARTAELAVLNSTLEERVQARTEELLTANTELEDEIARHQRTEAHLQNSAAELQALFDQPALGVTFFDTEGRYRRVNRRFAELVGRSVDELVGRRFADITEPEELAKDLPSFNEGLAGRLAFSTREKTYLRPDGRRIWLGVHVTAVVNEMGRVDHFIGLYEDIAERRRAVAALQENERRLQLALEASRQSLFEFSVPLDRFTFATEYIRGLGYEPENFSTDRERWNELTHPEDRATVLGAVRACLSGRAPRMQFEFRQRSATGSWHWTEARGSVVERDPAGQPLRLLGTFTDVTERRSMDERLRRTQRLESIGSLAGGIAHDLNNALVPLLAGVSFLREYVPAEDAELVTAMEASSRRAASMVQQLLVFAKGAEGRRAPVHPAALIEEMERFIDSTFPPTVQLHARCFCKSSAVLGDATQIHQILLNLCVNARDAMPQGGQLGLEARLVEVDAALAAEHDGAHTGPHVLFAVSDTGTGIPAAIRERIFDPFFTTKGPEKGTGLGLSTVLGIVRGHGGFVVLETEEGKGTRFLIYLPAAGGGEPAREEQPVAPALPEGNGRRVLVVDDEDGVRSMVERIFAGSGFAILGAHDGVEALARLGAADERIDLLLLDMTMPSLGGCEVLKRMRESGRMVPTVAMSGNFERDDTATLRDWGVGMLAKPFHRDDLVKAVRAALHLDS